MKGFMPYAHCKKAISIKVYKFGVLLPTIILGFIPTLLGIILENSNLAAIGTLMIAMGSGDFMIFWIIKNLPNVALVSDHPVKPGCVVYVGK
ncbi:hypothetical protein BD780_002951 [Clostridium tetanomorphum]|uniref:DUF3267 domain-containing protein n=1 Tax=Clostridium tetanomorphum TaxID=1553 RepID=A0A923EBC3_CLOTT|nr:DUF3267 domain-containing protein [Clostridium tetanomorphum]KAJ53706.1 hypothetical protein CTM_00515 [Clostridium tetanomorphum DSM 665]MBC2397218.1 DUF3267 domain-containing protein [Clostridium tetanomorphum]MBP1862434.1 hypothetical protein [Clostridium tetanomorphum]NRS85726.1 hypothetical protein [Clostridium tetanomorphum]NRZ96265.1 hypothetical protein [Clostridium tetanomorphum]